MKPLATITNENDTVITLSYDPAWERLFSECDSEPTMEVGPKLRSEQAAIEYIQDSYSNGWQLTWIES